MLDSFLQGENVLSDAKFWNHFVYKSNGGKQ